MQIHATPPGIVVLADFEWEDMMDDATSRSSGK